MEMKKYMTPEMEVIDIKVQGMLCISGEGSTPGDGGSGGGGGGSGAGYGIQKDVQRKASRR